MSWRGGGTFLYPVVYALNGAPDDLKLRVCTDLIETLLREGWDTGEGTWIDTWGDDDIVVQAFRANGVYREYCQVRRDEDTFEYCRREAGHLDDHRSQDGITWPQASDLRYGPLTEMETLRERLRLIGERAASWRSRRYEHGDRYWAGMRDAADTVLGLVPGGRP
jgi:hypothetical protein